MTEKRYLKWYNKVGYGSGDIAGNVVYAFLSSFVMIYLTNTVGLNPGIVGTDVYKRQRLHRSRRCFYEYPSICSDSPELQRDC